MTHDTNDRPEPDQDAAFFKDMRKGLNLTLRQAAAKAGVSSSYLYQVEKGDRGMSEILRRKLLLAYGLAATTCPNCDRMRVRLRLAEQMLCAALEMLHGESPDGRPL